MDEKSILKTLKDIRPEEIYVTSEQYKAIKHQKSSIPFKIKDDKIANALIICSLIKKEGIIADNNETNEEEYSVFQTYEYTGKYLLTPYGEYYLDYRKNKNKSKFTTEFRAWLTLIIAIVGLVLSIYSIYLNQLLNIK